MNAYYNNGFHAQSQFYNLSADYPPPYHHATGNVVVPKQIVPKVSQYNKTKKGASKPKTKPNPATQPTTKFADATTDTEDGVTSPSTFPKQPPAPIPQPPLAAKPPAFYPAYNFYPRPVASGFRPWPGNVNPNVSYPNIIPPNHLYPGFLLVDKNAQANENEKFDVPTTPDSSVEPIPRVSKRISRTVKSSNPLLNDGAFVKWNNYSSLACLVFMCINPLFGLFALMFIYLGKRKEERGMIQEAKKHAKTSLMASILGIIISILIIISVVTILTTYKR